MDKSTQHNLSLSVAVGVDPERVRAALADAGIIRVQIGTNSPDIDNGAEIEAPTIGSASFRELTEFAVGETTTEAEAKVARITATKIWKSCASAASLEFPPEQRFRYSDGAYVEDLRNLFQVDEGADPNGWMPRKQSPKTPADTPGYSLNLDTVAKIIELGKMEEFPNMGPGHLGLLSRFVSARYQQAAQQPNPATPEA